MIDIIAVYLVFLIIFMLVPAVIGTVLLFHVLILPKKKPMDESNRINHIRLVWFAIAHPQMFAGLLRAFDDNAKGFADEAFPWLTKDEKENVKNR